MRIGELAARTGVSPRSLRYYGQQGLLRSTRTGGGQREFTDDEVDRVNALQRLYTAGLSSQTIRALLPCLESPSTDTSDAAFTRLVDERDRLTAHMADLAGTLDSLNELILHNRADHLG